VSNVIQFPADERTWTELSRGLREGLSPHMGQQVIEWILADLKPRLMKITRSFSYSVQCPPAGCEAVLQEAGKAFEGFLKENTNQWLLQMVRLEAELYGAKSESL
jgi:hypothetical protein